MNISMNIYLNLNKSSSKLTHAVKYNISIIIYFFEAIPTIKKDGLYDKTKTSQRC